MPSFDGKKTPHGRSLAGNDTLLGKTNSSPPPVIRVRDLCKRYRKHIAVAGVDFEIEPGEIYGLIGPDGAGKSSVMKSIAGVLAFDGGTIDVLGVRVDSEASAERIKGRLGFMLQGLGQNLYPELSVEENVDFFARLREVPEQVLAERKRELLAMTRLERFRERPMKKLSGGMKQKLGLVCTLIHGPELLILDEPTTGVDPVSRRDFWAILSALQRDRGITALVSTAYMDEAARFHRLSILHAGRVLAAGEPDEILRRARGSLVELSVEPQIAALDRLQEVFSQVEALGDRLRVFVDDVGPDVAASAVAESLSEFEVRDLHVAEPSLEDAFVALLRRRVEPGP